MITHEEGGFKNNGFLKRHGVLLKFQLTVREHDIYNDIARMTQEAAHHLKTEFKKDISDDDLMYMVLVLTQLLIIQSQIETEKKVEIAISLDPKGKIGWDSKQVDQRALDSLLKPELLTDLEAEKLQTFINKHFPDSNING